jgi:hypothetical protein
MAIYWTYQDTGATSFDDTTRTATEYDAAGDLIGDRPYTEEENARADAAVVGAQETANKSEVETNLEEDLAAMQAVIDQTNEQLRADPSQEIKDIARAVRRLIRMALDDFSGTE